MTSCHPFVVLKSIVHNKCDKNDWDQWHIHERSNIFLFIITNQGKSLFGSFKKKEIFIWRVQLRNSNRVQQLADMTSNIKQNACSLF